MVCVPVWENKLLQYSTHRSDRQNFQYKQGMRTPADSWISLVIYVSKSVPLDRDKLQVAEECRIYTIMYY